MHPPAINVFISSTWLDLSPERLAVETAVQRMRETKFVGMEYFGSRDESTRQASLHEVDHSHVYIGIFGGRYGSGITEDEYRRARDRGLPCFIYFKDESKIPEEGSDTDPAGTEKLAALKSEFRHSERHTVSEFTTPDNLAAKITADLHRWLVDNYLVPQLEKVAHGQLPTATFQTLIEQKTQGFVGREFVFSAVDNWLRNPAFPSGYILIIGEPGIGKTALLAQLVRKYGYVHHFNIAAQGIRSHREFLRNVCAQLIVHYQLGYDTLRSDADESSAFLSQLLAEVAIPLSAEERVVIAVDALDEAEDRGLDPRANRLYLPGVLPTHVYFVVTTRPKHEVDFRLNVERLQSIYIEESDPLNLSDIRTYVREFIRTHGASMVTRLAEWGTSQETFSAVLAEKSEGNFLYLVHVLRDIEDGRLTADTIDISDLPQGLSQYYSSHWRAMRAQAGDRFDELYKPVVCQLATVREPVSISYLHEWTKVARTDIQVVVNEWRELLNKQVTARPEPAYRVYHASFRDFLREKIGLKPFHDIISETAVQKIAGWLGIKW
jgi:hypothetical protein